MVDHHFPPNKCGGWGREDPGGRQALSRSWRDPVLGTDLVFCCVVHQKVQDPLKGHVKTGFIFWKLSPGSSYISWELYKGPDNPASQLLPSCSGTRTEGKTKEVLKDRQVKKTCVWQNCMWKMACGKERWCVWKSCVKESVWQSCVWKMVRVKDGTCESCVWKRVCDKVVKRWPHWRAHTAQIRTFFFLRAPPTSTAAHAISSHVGSKRPGLGRLPPGHILLITKLPGQGVSKGYTRVKHFHIFSQ